MKIRTGFVSNSSSSSFVCFIEEKAFNEAYEAADEWTKKVVDLVKGKTKQLGNIKVVSTGYFTDMGGGDPWYYEGLRYSHEMTVQEDYDEDEDYDTNSPSETFYSFLSKIPEDCKISRSIDM